MMYPRVIKIPKGDLRPVVNGHVQTASAAVDLTGLVSCKFWMAAIADDGTVDSTPIIDGVAGSIVTASTGHLRYTWTGTDTNTVGRYATWFVGYWGAASTIPQTFDGPEVVVYDKGTRLVR